ncbi:hypothetical protein [Streptomyces sp. NPDC058572]|uniref:hypothetical protein n=1 Tax=Streptomyces sp. NPDC058572 TaxID=3346546 RepID=UPI00365CE462
MHRLLAADPAVVGAARIDVDDPDRRDQIKEAFYNDVDDRTADAATSLLTPDGPLGIPAEKLTVSAQRYGSIPHAYVTCTRDNAIPLALQHRFLKEIDAISASPPAVTELDSSHSLFAVPARRPRRGDRQSELRGVTRAVPLRRAAPCASSGGGNFTRRCIPRESYRSCPSAGGTPGTTGNEAPTGAPVRSRCLHGVTKTRRPREGRCERRQTCKHPPKRACRRGRGCPPR